MQAFFYAFGQMCINVGGQKCGRGGVAPPVSFCNQLFVK